MRVQYSLLYSTLNFSYSFALSTLRPLVAPHYLLLYADLILFALVTPLYLLLYADLPLFALVTPHLTAGASGRERVWSDYVRGSDEGSYYVSYLDFVFVCCLRM